MDRTALYFALTTMALTVVLSAAVILPRRLVRRRRNKPDDPALPAGQFAYLLAFGIIVVIAFYFEPWMGLGLLAASFSCAVVQVWRMPALRRSMLFAHLARTHRRPLFRAIDYAMIVAVAVFAALAIWDSIQ